MSFQLLGRTTEALRVVVVADDPLARTALEHLLGRHDDLVLSESLSDADVALWDGGRSAGAVPRSLRTLARPVVALVADGRAALEAMSAGFGAVARDADAGRIAAALLAASQGLVVMDAAFTDDVLAEPDILAEALPEPLTAREREVLELLAAGLSNRKIAERLGISEHTAKFHVNGILAKLGARTRTEAVVLAAKNGVLML